MMYVGQYDLHKKFTMPSHALFCPFVDGLFQTRLVRSATAFFAQTTVVSAVVLGVGVCIAPASAAQGLAPIALSASASASESEPGPGLEPIPRALENAPLPVRMANFGQEMPAPESQKLADWVVESLDNNKLPFAIVDKVNARIFVFDAQGQIRGASSVLLGLAVGDHSVPGIGQRKLSSIRPEERTTPAGRFVASLDRDIHGQEVLWVDYDTAVSLHPVVKGAPKERRAERLASASPLDKRISYGCINVPVVFYEKVVSPTFTGTYGVVYVLPEVRSVKEVFGLVDVGDRLRKQASTSTIQPSNSVVR